MALQRHLFVAALYCNFLSGHALGPALSTQKKEVSEQIYIPEWKIDLAKGDGHSWWSRFGLGLITKAIWGDGYPEITGSPAQNHQSCPIIKLPDNFVISAKRQSWTTLSGEWNTPNNVNLATWEQNYLGMGFSRDIKRVGVHFRSASTKEVAIRSRYFTEKEMLRLYDWRESSSNRKNMDKLSDQEEQRRFHVALLDCVGTLMYVVRQSGSFPVRVQLYGRDGKLIAQSVVGKPVLKYEFTDPAGRYLIATAEAPGINASIKRIDIPDNVQEAGVLPFGFHFETGGFKNSSALMETEYRWILAAAVQALDIYEGKARDNLPWVIITAVEVFIIFVIVLSVAVFFGLLWFIYRMVYPSSESYLKDRKGKIIDNPFLIHELAPGYGAER